MMLQRILAYLQVDRTFLGWVFLFSYFLVISNRVKAGMISWYTFTPEGPIMQFSAAILIFALIRFWLNRRKTAQAQQLPWRHYFGVSVIALMCYLTFHNAIGLLIAALFGTISRNFNAATLLQANLSYTVDLVLYAGIYLAYVHSKQVAAYQQQLADYNAQLAQLKIQQLQTQLNPHFVFNALNSLDELINVDTKRASDYLNDFANLYRLSLQNSNQQLIPLSQELAFAEHYFKLMQVRLGDNYQLQLADIQHHNQYWLPPFTLQLLLENAFLHNQASATSPLIMSIRLQQGKVVISNPLQPKQRASQGNGIGLANLAKQFLFLTGQNIEISRSEQQFTVCLPLIQKDPHV